MTKQQEDIKDAPEAVAADEGMARLSAAFETSARRWELIVYPSLFAFIVLAAYGFFLIYRLSGDIHYLTQSVDRNMSTMSVNIDEVSTNIKQMTDNVRSMTVSLDAIDKKVGTLEPILANMNSMDNTMKTMANTTQSMTMAAHNMQYDMNRMNQNIGRPMSFMNSFMPW
ncbi:MAG: hypothetical protein ACWA5Q_02655 [bacterium]